MKKITVKVDDILLNKMNERMKKNGCKTLSQCARELIELAIKIEEAASLQEGENAHSSIDPVLFEMLKAHMSWSMEIRFLTRLLVEKKGVDIDTAPLLDYMKMAKERSVFCVDEFVEKAQKSVSDSRKK